MNNDYVTRYDRMADKARAVGDSKAVKVAGWTAVGATVATAYVAASALLTYGASKLGEKIWDSL